MAEVNLVQIISVFVTLVMVRIAIRLVGMGSLFQVQAFPLLRRSSIEFLRMANEVDTIKSDGFYCVEEGTQNSLIRTKRAILL